MGCFYIPNFKKTSRKNLTTVIVKIIYTFADIKRGALFCKKHKDRLRTYPLFDLKLTLHFKYAPDPGNAGGGIGVMEFN
jgi:hypothetical protein